MGKPGANRIGPTYRHGAPARLYRKGACLLVRLRARMQMKVPRSRPRSSALLRAAVVEEARGWVHARNPAPAAPIV
jgi:hypothetical protein